MKAARFKKIIYITLGSLSLAIGTLGMFLPILPTTPLLLLTGFFYLRSSKKMYHWLIHHPIFGAYIYSYIKFKAISMKTKVSAITILWLSIIFSIYLLDNIWLQLMLFTIASTVTLYISSLKTLSKAKLVEYKQHQATFRN
ncbi:MAG: YbaN family protein [Alkalibacterium gilvum]|uniref:DUF454 domain-containing protein n=1 Tax=Alkalibacterium gilvum TaxID=1130080 RepID=A0A1H6UD99_9LACT|nr:YbaN family protein [Alkalibacterium gilvum]MDN6294365.1 YbaN family protein [Alkalibacterium sp.]MDN6318008.1 YbaN family protein [Lactococcus lactis]MDN6730424.1 YbaN family protein [Alkalibacterium sp.]SEI85822.1 hypothetical protein SAMN04488113_12611 [Alkalibacterium gilvum]HAJ70175.1 DUF454 domain-containing protein [Alkalibacterium sp.]